MKIALYNHTSDVSGAEISLLLNVKHMTRAEPVLFAPEGDLLDRARAFGAAVVPTPSYRARMSKNPFKLLKGVGGMLWSGYRFARALRKHEVDLVHANSLRAGMMVSLFAWLHRKPVVWHVRDIPPQGLIGKGIRALAGVASDGVIAISQPVKHGMSDSELNRLGKKIHLVHNGVELEPVTEEERIEHRERVRQELDTPHEGLVVTIIGQIAPWKRQEDAVRGAARLLQEGHDVYLWVVGEAKFRQENIDYDHMLRALAAELGIADRVRFAGFRKDVTAVCCATDLLLLCSDNEPFGRVIIEAMSQGVPVVATNAGGVPEIIVHDKCGLLYEVGDVEGLVRHAARLLSDAELRGTMGRVGAARVRNHFTIASTVEKVEDVYLHILEADTAEAETRQVSMFDPQAGPDGIVASRNNRAPVKPRVAIVHDYLNQMGGAERVVAVFHRMFPDAPIYTTIVDRNRLLPELKDADIRTTFMQRIPGILKRFKHFFWLYPMAMRSMNLRGYDLVISSSSAYGKGAPAGPQTVHICYCHTPMRFAWDFSSYMESSGVPGVLKGIARIMVGPLRAWDRATTRRVSQIIANSSIVQKRIKEHYGVTSPIIFPPVNITRFQVRPDARRDSFLVVSRLNSYKRIDLAVEACTRLALPLTIIGDGPDRKRLESLAGPTVRFMGRLSDEEVKDHMENCKAFLFPGIEDFGITPLEANACGRPVVAFRGGGALDTVKPGLNGEFFDEQTPESLSAVLKAFDDSRYNPEIIRRHAERFDESRFIYELSSLIGQEVSQAVPAMVYETAVADNR